MKTIESKQVQSDQVPKFSYLGSEVSQMKRNQSYAVYNLLTAKKETQPIIFQILATGEFNI